jgi:hypothetical protein
MKGLLWLSRKLLTQRIEASDRMEEHATNTVIPPPSPVLLQAATIPCADAQANQHVLGGDSTAETNGDAFLNEIAAQSGGQSVRQPGTTALGPLYIPPERHG